ncbi:MAG: hypothetical protein Q9170_006929 [Blastenia crenularia]
MAERSVFSFPALPSTSSDIIRLTAYTIVHKEPFQPLRKGMGVDATYAIPFAGTCLARLIRVKLAIVWIDARKNLTQSPEGPWTSKLNIGFPIIPIVQHHPEMTHLQGTVERLTSSEPHRPIKGYLAQFHTAQGLFFLRSEFEIFLDAKIAKMDAFYALYNISQHVASSSLQVLHLLDARIKPEMGVLVVGHHKSYSLDNLQYYTMFLDRHNDQNLRTVQDRGGHEWPSKSGKGKRAIMSAEKLQRHFEGLLEREL